jgi:hypothetical protein
LKFSHSRREIIPFLTVIAPSLGEAATIAASANSAGGCQQRGKSDGSLLFRPAVANQASAREAGR